MSQLASAASARPWAPGGPEAAPVPGPAVIPASPPAAARQPGGLPAVRLATIRRMPPISHPELADISIIAAFTAGHKAAWPPVGRPAAPRLSAVAGGAVTARPRAERGDQLRDERGQEDLAGHRLKHRHCPPEAGRRGEVAVAQGGQRGEAEVLEGGRRAPLAA